MLELTNYHAKRDRLQSILSSIRVVLADFNLKNREEEAKADYFRLNDEKFNLVVVGEFSRGKSTFVNAMLGRRMLPVSKNPTTAVISKIAYGERSEYIVHYKSGASKTISEDEFLSIKAQSEGDVLSLDRLKETLKAFVKRQEKLEEIDFVEIRYPLPLCKNNVEVIDTPGTNDLNTGRVDITYNYLKKADAAILVLMATQALTKSEMEFLREQIIGNQVNDIFIVINGKDQCKTPDEEARVVQYVSENLASVVPNASRISLVSSKQALTWRRKENGEKLPMGAAKFLPKAIENTGFPAFEEAIGNYLNEDRGRAKLEKYIVRAKGYLDAVESQIQAQYDAADHSTDEVRAQLAEMQPKVQRAQAESARIMQSMKTRLLSREAELSNAGRQAFTAIRQAATDAFAECSLDDTPEKIKHRMEAATTPVQKEFINNMTALQQNWTQTEWDKAVSEIKLIWGDMILGGDVSLHMPAQFDFASDITAGVEIRPNDGITAGSVIAGAGALAAFTGAGLLVLGAAVLAGSVLDDHVATKRTEEMKRQLRENFDQKYNDFNQNILSQYNAHVSRTCDKLQRMVNRRLGDMEQRLASVIRMKEASEGDAAKIMAKLEEKRAVAERLRRELAGVMAQ